MKNAMIYIHGKGGTAEEAGHYQSVFRDADVLGFDYQAQTPWEAREEFQRFFDTVAAEYDAVSIIANSIGAFLAMTALSGKHIEKAMFISPIVHMETLISDRMKWANITEEELSAKKEIVTSFGEILSWKYLCYVREHPVKWTIPTRILYGERDNLTSYETILRFAQETGASITIMKNGEHWFHTQEQMAFLDNWIRQSVW